MYNSKSESKPQGKAQEKYGHFEIKSYLQILTITKHCRLTHAQHRVLSYRVFKGNEMLPSQTKIAGLIGLNRETVGLAIQSLREMNLWTDRPYLIEPTWFAKPHADGECKYYRWYYLDDASDLTAAENDLLWILWSLVKYSDGRIRKSLRTLPRARTPT